MPVDSGSRRLMGFPPEDDVALDDRLDIDRQGKHHDAECKDRHKDPPGHTRVLVTSFWMNLP